MIINILLIGFIISGVSNILLHKEGIKNSLIWIILAFLAGYRTIEPISGLKLHPIEMLTYAACLRILLFNCKKFYKMPISIIMIGFLFCAYFVIDLLIKPELRTEDLFGFHPDRRKHCNLPNLQCKSSNTYHMHI